MRFNQNKWVLTLLVGGFIMIWRGTTDLDVAVAQGRKAVAITRIFTGPDGLAHAEDIELNLNARGATDMLKATGAEFSVRAPTTGANPRNTSAAAANDPGWHTGPARQFVITLSGTSEIEVSGGVHVAAGPEKQDRAAGEQDDFGGVHGFWSLDLTSVQRQFNCIGHSEQRLERFAARPSRSRAPPPSGCRSSEAAARLPALHAQAH